MKAETFKPLRLTSHYTPHHTVEAKALELFTTWRMFGRDLLPEIDLAYIVRAHAMRYHGKRRKFMFDAIWQQIENLWLQSVQREHRRAV